MTILVTGATGFVGGALVARLRRVRRHTARVAVRQRGAFPQDVDSSVVGDLTPETDWRSALDGVDAVVHLAARVHVMRETSASPLEAFRRVNVDASVHLAQQAVAAGCRRFVFVSSVKVNGEVGHFRESDPPAPEDAYGTSKHEAEMGLRAVAAETGLDVTIVRPPLVYGPGVGANFAALIRAVRRGIPLPFGAVRNKRSLVAVDNLTDLLLTCAEHPRAANETFLVSDGRDLSTPELVIALARAMGRTPRLVAVPPGMLRFAAVATGKGDLARRLLDSLQVDITKAVRLLDWKPPISVEDGLLRAIGHKR